MSSTESLRSLSSLGQQFSFPGTSPSGLVSSSHNFDVRVVRAFLQYLCDRRSVRRFVVGEREGEVFVWDVSPVNTSRYFEGGRARVLRRVRRRLSAAPSQGVFLTLTFSREIAIDGAWDGVWVCFKRFMDRLNAYRRRRGVSRRLVYSAHLEAHRDGYPHLHVWFPGLRWLAPVGVIDRYWEWGLTNVRLVRSGSVRRYITSYVSRVKSWPLVSLAFLWWFRIRLYNVSPAMYRPRVEVSGFRFVGLYRSWCEAVLAALSVVGRFSSLGFSGSSGFG